VKRPSIISVGKQGNLCWIRCESKGSFLNSSIVKQWTDDQFVSAANEFVMDLEACTGMDSTFMGMMAGLAIKLQGAANSCLQLCGVNNSNKESLEELGIDSLIEINPTETEWNSNCQTIRAELSEWSPEKACTPNPELIIDTHKTLGSLSLENEKEFSAVIKTFEAQQDE